MSDEDFTPPAPGGSVVGSGWGLAALLIGCTLLLSACVLMVFNIILFQHGFNGFRGIPLGVARPVAVVGTSGVAVLGLCAIVFGFRGWAGASRRGESPALGVAGAAAALVGLGAWVIAGLDLLLILGVFR